MAKAVKPVAARLDGGSVVVADPAAAAKLHERTLAGHLAPKGPLTLSLTEAAWAASQGRLAVTDGRRAVEATELAAAAARVPGGAALLSVYADLRERGLAVRHDGGALAVWPRGKGIDGPAAYHVRPDSEEGTVVAVDLHRRGGVVYGIVDRDGAVTYYEAAPAAPEGTAVESRAPPPPGRTGAGLERGTAPPAEPPAVRAARSALEEAGVTVRSGFRFGTELRGYRGDPDEEHADWIVQCAGADERLPWLQLARGIRVAHGVRKAFLVAVSLPAAQGAAPLGAAFVELSWFKP